MKAMILAAGFGSRLMPLTKENPKCMVEYRGKKLIDYEIWALKDSGIEDIAVVGGYLFDVLKGYVESQFNIKNIYQNINYDKTNMVQTFFCAREFIESCIKEKQDLVVSYADIVYSAEIVRLLAESQESLSIVVDKNWRKLWERRFENPLLDAETLKIQEGKVIEIGQKPKSYEEIQGQYIGLFKFSHCFLPQVLTFYDSLDRNAMYDGKDFDNMYMTSFLQALINAYGGARAVEIKGGWCEIDFKSDLEIMI
ncbi:phosphocholine cytidylyltransferase family protein [Helicobacter sp. MIT 21-1697]|uniref:phosphocholine cytidylyltransferase family protein n=1 Tax=Helicobacter sp. MIT 21-1697 TaxID=2993733 RepID=UPI00224B6822|nr:phosphocholine cytidylyltransferase family protein [Helicobacter sp. MIT 21-1697]MCX2717434.1 phosphocholine cytidylyltransferase family protein [Helicobacter sp. MIT 21-1697]